MSANFTSGFFVRQPAWHGMGNVLAEAPKTWADARVAADLTWEPVKAPVFGWQGVRKDGTLTFDPDDAERDPAIAGTFVTIEDKSRVVRSDSGYNLGVPGVDYAVINHDEIGAIIEAVSDQPNATYETTVVLDGGREIAALIALDEPITLPGDNSQTLPFMALTTRHDGTGSCRAQATSIRIVCWNTMSAAESEADRNGTVFVFSHTSNWRDHLEEARLAVQGLREDFAVYQTFAETLAKIPVTEEQTTDYLRAFIPEPASAVEVTTRVRNNIDRDRAQVRAILASATCETIAGTAFGLLQASTEFLDWYRPTRSESSRLRRSMLRPEERKQEAARLIRETVGA